MRRLGDRLRRLGDAVTWSSLWVAAAAVALTGAAGATLGAGAPLPVLVLTAAGTLVVYTVDRLRDVERDLATAPERSAFIRRHETGLRVQTGVAGAVAAWAGWRAGLAVVAVAGAVAVLGLLHRRLKRFAWIKPVYLTLAWTAVCVGLPAAATRTTLGLWPVVCVVGATVQANVALSNLRDDEGLAHRLGGRRVLALAAGFLLAALGIALSAGASVRPLAVLPLVALPTVVFYRPGERYGALVVDGALLAGGALAWALAAG